ncbi:MAG: RDD family protein [Lentisphaeria bacterium]|jgi:uncharacterized RDD family membrane protein YckC|nr:RDD family protein [Lentisphaeria bacterium]
MATGMKYLIRTPEEKEYGPVDQDTLVQWAQSGRIPPRSQIRNTLMSTWTDAKEAGFLKDIMPAEEVKDPTTGKSKWAALVKEDQKAPAATKAKALHTSGRFLYTPANTGMRFGAWLFDTVIVGTVLLLIFLGGAAAAERTGDANQAFLVTTAAMVFVGLIYYVFTMGFMAQTLGQRFWGIMIIRADGEPVFLARTFLFTIFHCIFFWSTAFFTFVMPSKRALHDTLSGIRVVRIAVRD